VHDPWVTRMISLPATVVSTTLEGPLNWPNATVVSGDAVDVVARLKQESEVPLRSHGSLSMNRALMAAGLVDRVQVTLFPAITGQTGLDPIFGVRPTSTSSCSRTGRSTVAPRSSSTDPTCIDMAKVLTHMCMSLDGFVAQPTTTRRSCSTGIGSATSWCRARRRA